MKKQTVILADGDFPRKGGKPWQILMSATRVIACDGAAAQYKRRFSRWPDYTVGDMDSLANPPPDAIKNFSEDENDLSKAISFCRSQGWKDIVIVGATGKREDHTIANIYIALDAQIPVVTDRGEFRPVCGKVSLKSVKGAGVSVFAPNPATVMSSRGLVWPLEGVKFVNSYCAASNRASSSRIQVTSSHPAFVFLEEVSSGRNGQ